MVAFALTTARAFVGAPVATASIGGQAGKAAVAASARAVPAFARFGVAARLGLGVQTASPVAASARVASARAFHLTAFAADEDGEGAQQGHARCSGNGRHNAEGCLDQRPVRAIPVVRRHARKFRQQPAGWST